MEQNTVLVVEDDDNIRDLYTTALQDAGFTVWAAADGETGVQLALVNHPAVILMDIVLPDINGHQAVEKIRNDRWGKDAKIIFLTNMTDASDVVRAVDAGSADYIIKVYTTPKELVNTVRTTMHT